ncbi:MAG: phage major capsid protein [Opitutaceae bacterium]|jgi:HK97 family phage major capsid protein|nr:phage major capsid protein [Opitutaceae bacterium]
MKFLFNIIAFLACGHFRLGVVEPGAGGAAAKSVDEQLLALTQKINTRLDRVDDIEKAIAENKKGYDTLTGTIGEVQKQMLALQKLRLSAPSSPARKGHVSVECARHLGGIALALGLKRGQVRGDTAEGLVKDILGIEAKAALGAADFALTEHYSAEVLELVAQYGAARQYGTVFPLGAATVKLPRLKTDPAFGLIAMSASIPEKSPAVEWVTFSPSKWGGMVRIPAEIDADSIVAIGQFIARYSARQLAKLEDLIFFAGDGGATHDNLKGLLKLAGVNGRLIALATGKTKFSDVTLAALREMRALPSTAVLGSSAYFFHQTFEQCFIAFNTGGDKPYNASAAAGGATLDGFPIRWVESLPPWSKAASVSTTFGLFGDPSYHYLGVRGVVRYDTSTEAGFNTDEILVRCLERFTTGLMAPDAIAGIATGGASG